MFPVGLCDDMDGLDTLTCKCFTMLLWPTTRLLW